MYQVYTSTSRESYNVPENDCWDNQKLVFETKKLRDIDRKFGLNNAWVYNKIFCDFNDNVYEIHYVHLQNYIVPSICIKDGRIRFRVPKVVCQKIYKINELELDKIYVIDSYQRKTSRYGSYYFCKIHEKVTGEKMNLNSNFYLKQEIEKYEFRDASLSFRVTNRIQNSRGLVVSSVTAIY